MELTHNLALPYIMPSQAQKHVTHNEALRILDTIIHIHVKTKGLQTAPALPGEGDRYIVADEASDIWLDHARKIAAFIDGAWLYIQPSTGWTAYVEDATEMLIYKDDVWQPLTSDTMAKIGINSSADSMTRLSVNTRYALFNHDSSSTSGDINIKLNKAAPTDEALLSFGSNWSSKAFVGLLGNDDFSLKVTSDGSAYKTAMSVSTVNGKFSLNESAFNHSTMNIKGVNSSGTADGYFCFTVTNTNSDMANKGGAVITCAPYSNNNTPWTVLAPWSTDSSNIIYYGGGGWGVPDATEHQFYSGTHQPGTPDTATLALKIAAASIITSRDIIPSLDDSFTLGTSSSRWSEIHSATNVVTTSDIRTKRNIADCELGLQFISALRPVSFHKKENATDAMRHHGLIAQEVRDILGAFNALDFAGWVDAGPNEEQAFQGLRYEQFIPPLIKAVQELNLKLDRLAGE